MLLKSTKILGRDFAKMVCEAMGVDFTNVRSVIIHADVTSVTTVEIQHLGDYKTELDKVVANALKQGDIEEETEARLQEWNNQLEQRDNNG